MTEESKELLAALVMGAVGATILLAMGGNGHVFEVFAWYFGIPLAVVLAGVFVWVALAYGVLAFAWVCRRPALAMGIVGSLGACALTLALLGPLGAPPWAALVIVLMLRARR